MLKFSYFGVLLLILLTNGSAAQAQLFGTRQLRQPLQQQLGPSRFSQAGELQGNERYLRQNRGRADFVGTDLREQQSFVGSQQAGGARSVVSSTAGLQESPDRGSQINRPLAKPDDDEIYHPTLEIAFTMELPPTDLGARLTAELSKATALSPNCRIEVSVEGRTALLQGEVTSARERDLAQIVVLFEPGIAAVNNQLRVGTVPPLPATSREPAPGP